MKRVLCLYRVSTKGQVDQNTDDIPMQRRECLAFIDRMEDWVFFDERVEKGVSGYKVSAENRDAILDIRAPVSYTHLVPGRELVRPQALRHVRSPPLCGWRSNVRCCVWCRRRAESWRYLCG